ncbi:MAG: PorV/PorQ family protein [bacterium]
MKGKTFRIAVIIAIFMSLISINLFAEAGTTSAVFLKLEQGARPISMGGAFVGAADDVNAVMWNPAGLSKLPAFQLTLSHTVYFADMFYSYLAAGLPVGDIGAFGIGVVYVNSGKIKSWDVDGVTLPDFSASDIGVNLAYGTKINPSLSLGITVKLFSETISTQSAFGFAADLGGIIKLPIPDLQAGVVIANLGPKFGFSGEAFMLPIEIKAGLSYTGVKNLMINMDYIQPIETRGILALGFEYWYKDIISIRMGYQFQGKIDPNDLYNYVASPGVLAGFVAGAGIKLGIYQVDYCYKQYGVLESTHRIGLTLKFK